MADTNLPEGTDTIISDAELSGTGSDLGGATASLGSTGRSDSGSSLVTGGYQSTSNTANEHSAGDKSSGSGGSRGVKDAIKGSTEKLRSTASDKAMGLVSQGIERSSGGLSNVSALIGDTAANLDERLGTQYGDYARSAAQAIERAASNLGSKDPDELVNDARALVRKSPAVALAGAAIVGFALVRVIKSGLSGSSGNGSDGPRRSS